MKKPLVSFVIPVYNASHFLKSCVGSVLSQTFSGIEVILVDDGSVDESKLICDSFVKNDNRVIVYHQQNKGVSAARNKGIELAQGDYVAFIDADDWIDANVCEIFAEALKTVDYDLFCYSAVYHGKRETRSFLFNENVDLLSINQKDELHCKVMAPSTPWYEYNCNTRFAGSACGKFYRTEILKKNQIKFSTKTIISEDVLFNVLAMDFFDKIGYTTKAFYHYQINSASAQNRYRRSSMMYFGFIIDEIQGWLLKNRKNSRFQDCANSLFVHYLFGALKEDYFHKDNPDQTLACTELRYVLSQEKYQNILKSAPNDYFSTPEKILITLMQQKMIFVIEILMRIYNGIQTLVSK